MTHTSTGHVSSVEPPPAIIPTSTGHKRELSNLAETYIDETQYSGRNNSFTPKLGNPWKDALASLLKNFRMGRTSGRDPFQTMRWMRWMRWDKAQDERDEARVGVG